MILVFGGTGFIGRNLVRALDRQKRRCITVSRRPDQAFLDAEAPGVEALSLERFRSDPAAALFGGSALVYLASTSTPGSYLETPWNEAGDNLDPLMQVLQAVQRHNPQMHVVLLSSGGTIYGQNRAERLTEDMPPAPISPYGLGKLWMEEAVGYMARRHGLRSTILRPANPIGRWQKNRSQGVVGVLMRAAAAGTEFPMMGDGSAVRDYFDVADLVAAIQGVIDKPETCLGKVFNVGSGEGHSLREMLALVEEATGRRIPVRSVPSRASDVDRVVLDTARIAAATGWKPQIPLSRSLQALWQHRTEV